MKTTKFLVCFFLLATLSFIFPSCQKDACSGITCLNGGFCANGLCNCPTGYTGSNCSIEQTPVSMSITRIEVSNYPTLTTSGGGWDLSTGADPYIALSLGTSSSSLDGISGYKSDVTGGMLSYTISPSKTITNLSSAWAIGFWDYDTPDPDDFMAGIQFVPSSFKSGFPSSFTLTTSQITFTLYVTWNF